MTFHVRSDRHLVRPTHRSNRFVLVEVTAPPARAERVRPPVNLAFVLDRSGSMGGEKIRLAKQAIEEAVARLHDDDRFAIVTYDDHIDVVVPGTRATPDARRGALERLREIDARGSTNLGEGWLRGAEQVALALSQEGVNRCLLLTDGLANVGITDRDELARHAGELRTRGVSTTTFGVGADFDEVLLQAIASAGGGHFYFIATAASIRDHISSEVGETLEVVARGVTLEISAPEGVRVESLSPYPVRDGHGRTEVTLGDLTSEERVEVILRLNFPYGELGRTTGALFALSDRRPVERPPGARPRRRPGGCPDLRRPRPPGGRRTEPRRRLRRCPAPRGGDGPPDPRLRRARRRAARDPRGARGRPPRARRADDGDEPQADVREQFVPAALAHARREGQEGARPARQLRRPGCPRRTSCHGHPLVGRRKGCLRD
jgi:uncharacterized protein YegL